MKVKHRQFKSYGCGVYAVANALNLDSFPNEERLKEGQSNNIGQLSRWLQDDGTDYYIEILYYNHLGKKLPRSTFDYKPDNDNHLLPVLFAVRKTENSLNHLIAGKISNDGTLYLYDSLCENVIETKVSKINNMYEHVYGMYLFSNFAGDYVFIG